MGGILAGIDKLTDDALGIGDVGKTEPHYSRKESWLRLCKDEGARDPWPALVSALASRIESNWDRKCCGGGRKNWRIQKMDWLANENRSPEKQLEKGIAKLEGWTNQIPICSGINDANERKRSVDLARVDGVELELIELKVRSNTPLHAAIEILVYGLVYRFSRMHRDVLGYTMADNPLVFSPTRVALKVLAPDQYYPRNLASLARVENGISAGLGALPSDGYLLTFSFDHFDASLISDGKITDGVCQQVISGRGPVMDR